MSEELEYAAKIFSMFVNGAGVDDDVMNISLRKRAARSEKIIHGTLKSTGCVAQSKRHNFELLRSEFGMKSSTADMLSLHSNLMITLRQVDFAEKLQSHHAIKYFVNPWKHGSNNGFQVRRFTRYEFI